MNSSRRKLNAEADRYAHMANNGLRVTKRTSLGVTLAWPENEMDVVTYTDSKVSCLDLETELDSQGNWFIVQMRKMSDESKVWATIYKGYGLRCDVDGLDSDSLVLFRMKRNGEKRWGSEIIASTDPPQASGEDLNRAVEMNSEYLVTRILGNTPHGHLRRILGAHDKNGMTPLMVACHNGNPTIAKMLLSCGASVNDASTGVKRTPLMFACIIGKLNIVQLLDQYGCDWRPKDKSGSNALHHAINGGNLAIVRCAYAKLGQHLAFEADNCGWTPLMRAVILSDNLEVVKFLIGKGANPNEVDRTNSKSVLMAAILSKKTEFVKFLLEWGADPFYKNLNGQTCYEVARGLGYPELAKMILKRIETLRPNHPKPSSFVFPVRSINNNQPEDSLASLNNHTDKIMKDNVGKGAKVLLLEDANDNENIVASLRNDQGTRGPVVQKYKSLKPAPLHSSSSAVEAEYLMLPNSKANRL